MNWIKRLALFFKTEPDLELIPLAEMADWLALEAKSAIKESKGSLSETIRNLKDRRWMLECYLDDWEEKLRIGSMVDVSNLLLETRKVLEQITFAEAITFERILSLSRQLESDFEMLIKQIEGSDFEHNYAFILDQGGGKEREKITLNPLLKEILEMEGIRQGLELQLIKSGLRKIEAIIEKLKQLELTTIRLDQLQTLIRYKSERLKTVEASRIEREKEYRQLEEDSRYLEVQAIDNRKREIQNRINQLNYNLKEFFTDLQPLANLIGAGQVLGAHYALLEKYLSDYLIALTVDNDLKILPLLFSIKEDLVSGLLPLEADEAQIVFFRLSAAAMIKEWHNSNVALKTELRQINRVFIHQDFLARVEDIRYRLEHYAEKSEQGKENIYQLEMECSDLKEIAVRDQKLIEDLVKIGLRKEIQIVV
ncbi:MAG TPA: hypothetical protein VJH68_00930 [Candidatus Nanoarchaeia archaeon]|nr:hypothetical protein [Candidatus Nanoarchaeia archaeon]